MKYTPVFRVILAIIFSTLVARPAEPAKSAKLDVVALEEVPAGSYELQLQHEGEAATVRITIENNRADFVESTSSKLDGLSGTFEPIGNGVFLARLRCRNGAASQFWIFKPDGTAAIKEIPDRHEKQTAKRTSKNTTDSPGR